MREAYEWIRDIIVALIVAGTILLFLKPIIVKQESMQPTFYSNDYVVISRQAYNLFGDIEKDDVIVFKSKLVDSAGDQKYLIKRVIAVGGDKVEISDGYVYVNGEQIEEPYLAEQGVSGDMKKVTIEEGKLFVMGDNRRVSQDSRSPELGQVDEASVIGKVVFRILPLDSFGAV